MKQIIKKTLIGAIAAGIVSIGCAPVESHRIETQRDERITSLRWLNEDPVAYRSIEIARLNLHK